MKFEIKPVFVDHFISYEIVEDEEGEFDTYEEARESLILWYEETIAQYKLELTAVQDCKTYKEFEEYDW